MPQHGDKVSYTRFSETLEDAPVVKASDESTTKFFEYADDQNPSSPAGGLPSGVPLVAPPVETLVAATVASHVDPRIEESLRSGKGIFRVKDENATWQQKLESDRQYEAANHARYLAALRNGSGTPNGR